MEWFFAIAAILMLAGIITGGIFFARWRKKRNAYLARREAYVRSVLDLPVGYYRLHVLWFAPVTSQPGFSEVITAARKVFRVMERGYRVPRFGTQADLVVFGHQRLR